MQKGHRESQVQGLKLFDQLLQVPEGFKEGAAVARVAGTVSAITEAPQGGYNVAVMGETHYVPQGFNVTVKLGDNVEAGDTLSDGIPNPGEIVKYKGIGEGRRQFVDIFRNALKSSGVSANRRNIEVLSRGLINHVRVTELDGAPNALPEDVVEYSDVERGYEPRYGFAVKPVKQAVNMYLEKPAMHYTIGTPVTKRVAETLQRNGIPDVVVHPDPPGFQPEMVRAMENLMRAPDWQVRLGGSFLSKGLLESAHRGRASKIHSESYIPAVMRGTEFGKGLRTKGEY